MNTPSMFAWRSKAALALLQLVIDSRHTPWELELAEIMGPAAAVGEELVAVALTEDGDNAARLLQAVTVLEDSPRVLARTRGLLELVPRCAATASGAPPGPFLHRALELADRHGVTVLAGRALIELQACAPALGARRSPARTL